MALPAPIAYWPFDEATGTSAADASGHGHTATLVHGTWDTSGLKKFGAAALANTAGGNGATFTSINLGTVHSIAFWINNWNLSSGVGLGGPDSYAAFLDTSYCHYYCSPSDVYVAHGLNTASHHLVITRSGTTITFYKDGALLGTQTLATSAALTLSIISGWPAGSPLTATLDDVRLYDVALTGAEVAELFALDPMAPVAVETTQTYVWGPI